MSHTRIFGLEHIMYGTFNRHFEKFQTVRLIDHPQLEQQISQFSMEKVMLYTIFKSADFSQVIVEMIGRPKTEGSQSLGTMG